MSYSPKPPPWGSEETQRKLANVVERATGMRPWGAPPRRSWLRSLVLWYRCTCCRPVRLRRKLEATPEGYWIRLERAALRLPTLARFGSCVGCTTCPVHAPPAPSVANGPYR